MSGTPSPATCCTSSNESPSSVTRCRSRPGRLRVDRVDGPRIVRVRFIPSALEPAGPLDRATATRCREDPMSDYLPGLVWLVVLLAGNAFFVGAEFAVIAARRSQIEPRAAAGSRAAKTTLYAMEHATLMLATSQLGITVCSLVILNVSEPAIHHLLEHPLGATSLSPDDDQRRRIHRRAGPGDLPARRLRRDGPEEHRVLRPGARGAHPRAAAGPRVADLPPRHLDPELARERRRTSLRGANRRTRRPAPSPSRRSPGSSSSPSARASSPTTPAPSPARSSSPTSASPTRKSRSRTWCCCRTR